MSQRVSSKVKIFLPSDVERQAKNGQIWVIHNDRVYDVTMFANDHPGGDDIIRIHSGKDITEILKDPEEHVHSEAAYELLKQYQIGVIGDAESTVREDLDIDETYYPDETKVEADFDKHKFFDLTKPLLPQIWNANWSKDFYLHQVHQPRHLPEPATLFGPWYLEMFSCTPWYVVPIVWGPIAAYLFNLSLEQQNGAASALPITIACFLLGNFIWTILEYGMHRFLFHIDDYLPDKPIFLTLHFLLHGIHHFLPMDAMRLVMPPVLFAVLEFPFTRLAYLLFPVWMANGIISGAFSFYILYDTMHYALHHTKLPKYVKEMKSYHMKHHFANYELGFGVTSKLWDIVFGTELS